MPQVASLTLALLRLLFSVGNIYLFHISNNKKTIDPGLWIELTMPL